MHRQAVAGYAETCGGASWMAVRARGPATTITAERLRQRYLRTHVTKTNVCERLSARSLLSYEIYPPMTGASARGWDGRAAAGAEYVAYSSNSSGTITVDLSGESGNWRLLEWDPAGSLEPIDRGVQAGGAVRTWNVAKGETAVVVMQTNFEPARAPILRLKMAARPPPEKPISAS